MTHLTMTQVLQTVDGTSDYATQAAVTSHLAVCAQCRAEVEFQRSILRNARRAPLPTVSDRFAKSVMSKILPRRQNPLAAWVLNNMGNAFAMMAVLGVLTYVLISPAPVPVAGQGSAVNALVQELQKGAEDSYSKLTVFLQGALPTPDRTTASKGSRDMTVRLILIGASFGVLALADRFWISRLRARPRA